MIIRRSAGTCRSGIPRAQSPACLAIPWWRCRETGRRERRPSPNCCGRRWVASFFQHPRLRVRRGEPAPGSGAGRALGTVGRAAVRRAKHQTESGRDSGGLEDDNPDIDVYTLLLAGSPRDTVDSVSAEVQLLVVGSPYRGREWARWIRSVARAVLDRATCPVAVVPQQHPRSAMAD
jgi:Universal stress protein family